MRQVTIVVPSLGCPSLRDAVALAFPHQQICVRPGDHSVGVAPKHAALLQRHTNSRMPLQLEAVTEDEDAEDLANDEQRQQQQQQQQQQVYGSDFSSRAQQDQSGSTILHIFKSVHIFGMPPQPGQEECIVRGMLVLHPYTSGSLVDLTLLDSGDCNVRLVVRDTVVPLHQPQG